MAPPGPSPDGDGPSPSFYHAIGAAFPGADRKPDSLRVSIQASERDRPVPVPASIRPGRFQVKRIARTVSNRCELCGDEWPAHLLEIHFIRSNRSVPPPRKNLHRWILVLCPRCHGDVHRQAGSFRDQMHLVSLRDPEVSREIRRILLFPSRSYEAPESFDPDRFFLDPSPVPWGWVV